MIIITYNVPLIKTGMFIAYKIIVGKLSLHMKTLIFMNFLSLFIFGSVTSGFSFTLIIGISYMSVICCYFICCLLWEKAK